MRFTVWDTETTGFPVREGTLDQQPYIIQFAAITGDINSRGEFTEVERTDILIKPRISIPFASSQVHGIYDRDVEKEKYIEAYLDTVLKILNGSDMVV